MKLSKGEFVEMMFDYLDSTMGEEAEDLIMEMEDTRAGFRICDFVARFQKDGFWELEDGEIE